MKENFDDILKRRWEEQSFPVDDGHRAEMIELLNNQKRRRAFPFWWFGGLAIVLMAGVLFLFMQKDSTTPELIQQPKGGGQSISRAPSEIASIPDGNTVHESELKNTVSSAANTSQNKGESNTIVKTENQQSNTNVNQFGETQPGAGTSIKRIKQTQGVKKADSNVAISNQQVPMPPSETSTKTYLVDDQAAHSYNILSVPVAVIVEPDVETGNIQGAEANASSRQRNLFLTPVVEPLSLGGLFYRGTDQMSSILPQVSHPRYFYLFGEAGAGIIMASKPDFTSGWKLRAGGGLGYKLSSKIQLTWSAGYMMQHGGFDFERTSTVNVPGFGVRSNFNTLTPQTLHFVYTRLGAQYRLHRHMIAVHGGMQYLYGAYGHISTQTQDQFAPGLVETSSDTWVKTDGLQTLLWTGDIAYGYQITPRWSVMAGTDIYFSNFTKEDPALKQEGYYWKGAFSSLHPFVTLNYLIHGRL